MYLFFLKKENYNRNNEVKDNGNNRIKERNRNRNYR